MNLTFWRKRAGMTQDHLADLVGVSRVTLSRWESGKREPNLSFLKKICQALSLPEAELLNGPANNGEIKFTFVMDIREVETMDVRMNEFKVGTGDSDIFGLFRFPKDLDVDAAGQRFVNYLRAELAGDKVKRDALKKLEAQPHGEDRNS